MDVKEEAQIYRMIRSVIIQLISFGNKVSIMLRWHVFSLRSHQICYENVIVSLTSYQLRFPTLVWTLKSLLLQSGKPSRLILWVGEGDRAMVPDQIERLVKYGLEIRATKDIGPYTKIIPALAAFPEATIVTADDDIYYPHFWLKALVETWSGNTNEIVFHRGHIIRVDQSGIPMPYNSWYPSVKIIPPFAPVFPTGVAGVLYPPRSLHPEVTNAAAFLKLCPKADDVWLYWMGRLNNVTYRKTPRSFRLVNWVNSQSKSLSAENVLNNGNDMQIGSLLEEYPIIF
jgi:hypothetical protein